MRSIFSGPKGTTLIDKEELRRTKVKVYTNVNPGRNSKTSLNATKKTPINTLNNISTKFNIIPRREGKVLYSFFLVYVHYVVVNTNLQI